jgi:teichuronic acid exporter
MSLQQDKKSLEQTFRHKVLKGFLWAGTSNFFSQLISWASTILVIRLLSPSDYGLMAMITIAISFFLVLSEVGLGASVIQTLELKDHFLRQLFGFVLLTNFLAAAITFLGAPLIARLFSEPQLKPLISVSSITFILIALYALPQSLLVRDLNFQEKAKVDLFSNIISAITSLLLALAGFGVWALVISFLVLHAVKAIGFGIVNPVFIWPSLKFSGIRSFLRFGSIITLERILYYFYGQADKIIGGKILGKELLGFYSVGLNLASAPLDKVMSVVTHVMFPAYSRIQTDGERLKVSILKSIGFVSLVSFPLFFGMAIIAPDIIPLILGSKWWNIVLPFQLYCLVLPLRAISSIFHPPIMAINRPGVNFWNMAIISATMTSAFFIGVWYGMVGLVLAWVIVYPLVFFITSYRAMNTLKIPIPETLSTIKVPFLGSLVMVLGMMVLKYLLNGVLPLIPRLSIVISIGIFLYFSVTYRFNRKIFIEVRNSISLTSPG